MKRFSLAVCCLCIGLTVGVFFGRPLLQGQSGPPAAVPSREWTSYRHIVKKVLPAVVSLEALGKAEGPRAGEKTTTQVGFGSGVLVDSTGVVLTSYHVVRGADEVLVQLHDKTRFRTKDIRTDSKTDLALIRFKPKKKLPTLELGDSGALEMGDRILAVGAPFGLIGSVTHGIISAKGRALNMNMYEDFIQTDAAVNPGNSGGPLIDMEGKVVGINSVIKSRTGGFQGVGLAVSSNLARSIMTQLLRNGVVRRGYLGVHVDDIDTAEQARKLGLDGKQGVLVSRVFPNTPGSKSGIKKGDVIASIAGKTLRNGRDLQAIVAGLEVGNAVDAVLVREGTRQTVRLTIEELPKSYGVRRRPRPPIPPEGPPERR